MLHAASLLGITYRDSNALLLFVLWPALTVGLAALVVGQGVALRRLQKR
jgi:hypothetical protein